VDPADWGLEDLWEVVGAQASFRTRRFVEEWQGLLGRLGPAALVDRADARALIVDRERATKGANARTVNAKAREQWGGASGTAALDFRWSTSRVLLADIRAGLDSADAED
jgi:hypothetical protein